MQEEAGSVDNKKKSREAKIPTVSEIVENESKRTDSQENADSAADSTVKADAAENDVKKSVEDKENKAEVTENKAEITENNAEAEVKAEVSENNAEKADEVKADEKPEAEVKAEASETEPAAEETEEADEEDQQRIQQQRSTLNLDSETALLETVLFLESEPQTVENLSKITELSEDVINECIDRLQDKYSSPDSGIEVTKIIGGWLLTPKKEYFDLVKERYGKKNEGRLSKAAIETLSIIAYSQPITRNEIQNIRHANVDNMMRLLIERNFVKEVGKKDVPGKPVLYGTTKEFLEFFHLQSIADLPQLDAKESERFELAR